MMQILLEDVALTLTGTWMEADTCAHMKEVRDRMNGALPYGSCLWHVAVSAIAIWVYCWGVERPQQSKDIFKSVSITKGLIILAGTVVSVGIRTTWLRIRVWRERRRAEAAARQQA